MVIVGLDVGYSNLKIAAGEAGGVPQVSARPAGAAPAQRLGERVGSGPAPADGIYVDGRGQRWIAAVEPGRLEGWQRPLHEDYAASPAYEALVKAGLVLADIQLADGSSGIDAVKDILARHDVPVIFITAFPERLLTGEGHEPAYVISKPFNPDNVVATVWQALLVSRERAAMADAE